MNRTRSLRRRGAVGGGTRCAAGTAGQRAGRAAGESAGGDASCRGGTGSRRESGWNCGGVTRGCPLCKQLGLPLGHVARALGMKRSGNLSYQGHFGCPQSFKIPSPHPRPLSVVVLPISLHLLFPLFSTDSSPGYFFSPCIFLFPLGLPSNFLSSGFLPVGSALALSILRGTGRGRPSLLLPVAAPLSLSSLLS